MISACLIVRDDAETLAASLEDIRPHVDEIVVVDTGSIDASPQIAKRYADKWELFLGCNDPATELIEDFSLARNRALELATGEIHWWQDGDDRISGAEHIRSLAAGMGPEALVLVAYDYSFDPNGRPTCVHWRESLVKPRDKWRWSIPVHEVLTPQFPTPAAEPTHLVKRIHRKHLSKKTPDPERNLRILKKYVAKVGEGDVRAWYYLGVEYSIRGDIGNALRVLKRYVELAGWADEKCLALLEIARIYQRVGDYSQAIEWAQRAMITKSWPEPYWTIVECFYALAAQGIDEETNCRRAMHFAEVGMMLPAAETVLFVNPMKRYEIYAILHQLYARFGQLEKALESVKKGLEGIPEDPDMKKRLLQYDDILTKNTFVRDAQRLAGINTELQRLGAFDAEQWGQLQRMVGAVLGIQPQEVRQLAAPTTVTEQIKADGCLDIVFFLGPAYEEWSPATLMAGGMGGSETMAWELARRLRALGHRVRMFSHAGSLEGVYDGVEYIDWQKYPGTSCDVLIASRRPDAADRELGVTSRLRLLWVHDVHVGTGFTPARAMRFDAVLCLSEWHKQYMLGLYHAGQPALLAKLQPEDIVVTRNGIDRADFKAQHSGFPPSGPFSLDELRSQYPDEPIQTLWARVPGTEMISVRNPKRLIYSSSPDRGLQILLEMWPSILAQEPEAELYVAYGFSNWEKSVASGQDHGIPWLSGTALRQIKHAMRTLPRIKDLGRIGPKHLAQEMLCAGVWAYPTWFSETSCITAMQAQAAGLYCVATPIAALNETLGGYGTLIPGSWEIGGTDAERAEFIAATVRAIRGEQQPYTLEELQKAAERFDLDALAKDWDAMIRKMYADACETVVKAWRAA